MTTSLARLAPRAHALVAEVIPAGGLVVDLTAGQGQDTLALYRMVGPQGQVIAFDIQQDALQHTKQHLREAGACISHYAEPAGRLTRCSGVTLCHLSHDEFSRVVPGPVQGVIANLGYLPGGDQGIITRSESTLAALEQSCAGLALGGRLVVMAYPGHAGGAEECEAVGTFFAALAEPNFTVLELRVSNRELAPCLFVAEKNGGPSGHFFAGR